MRLNSLAMLLRVFTIFIVLSGSLSTPIPQTVKAEDAGGTELPAPQLLKDINSVTFPSEPGGLYSLDGYVYFAADSAFGREVWRTDGTQASTQLVCDINPGEGDGVEGQLRDEHFFGNLGSTIFFPANDGSGSGIELWKTDGTSAGTALVKDINPSGDSRPDGFVSAGGFIFFAADDGSGQKLWRSDGTPEGTFSSDILAPAYDKNTSMAAYGGTVYFQGSDATNGSELWRWNGQAGQADLVADINPSGDSTPDHFKVVGDSLYFSADDGVHGVELWKTSAGGTEMVLDINPGAGSSSPSNLASFNGQAYFAASTVSEGRELWRSDGTAGGTILIADTNPGMDSGIASYTGMVEMGGTLYFVGGDNLTGLELRKTDGVNTSLVMDINPGATNSNISSLVVVRGSIYFSAKNLPVGLLSEANCELWRSDGTAVGTQMVKDISPGAGSAFNYNPIVTTNGKILFAASDRLAYWDLWVSDGSETGTLQLAVDARTAGAAIDRVILFGSRLFFAADDGLHGLEPWISDGSPAGTHMIKDLVPGKDDGVYTGSLASFGMLIVGQKLYFSGYELDGQQNRWDALWVTDGSAAGTQMVLSNRPQTMAAVGNLVFFLCGVDDNVGLFKSDGTLQGTVELKHWGWGYDHNNWSVSVDGRYYFYLRTPNGTELWESDGTPAGTRLATITPRVDLLILKGGVELPGGLILYVDGGKFWQSSGNPGSEQVVSGDYQYSSWLQAVAGGWLYFIANNEAGTSSNNLYRTKGVNSGVELVAEDIQWIEQTIGDQVYFGYWRQINGTWFRHLGRAGGEPLVVERFEPASSDYTYEPSSKTRIAQIGEQAYFYGKNETNGAELWTSDGTPAGTHGLDLYPGLASSNAENLFFVLGRLFFTADDGMHGKELWVVDTLTQHLYLPVIRK